MLLLRDLPKYECIRACGERFGVANPSAIHGCLLLLRVASDLLARLEQCFAEAGLSQGRFTVLMLLNRPGAAEADRNAPATPSDLADRAGVTRATMTGLLDGLEREGFIEREVYPQDRRMLAVRITALGRHRLESMLPDYFRLVSELMSPLAEPERETLIQLLNPLRAQGLAPCPPTTPSTHPSQNGHRAAATHAPARPAPAGPPHEGITAP
jgi:DNA-binding MarR family transcriptional regulator